MVKVAKKSFINNINWYIRHRFISKYVYLVIYKLYSFICKITSRDDVIKMENIIKSEGIGFNGVSKFSSIRWKLTGSVRPLVPTNESYTAGWHTYVTFNWLTPPVTPISHVWIRKDFRHTKERRTFKLMVYLSKRNITIPGLRFHSHSR